MSIKTMIFGIAAVASVALPGAASAQSYGQYGYGNGGGYNSPRYDDRGFRGDDRFDRHERQRWEQRRRWEERQREREWRRWHRHQQQFDRGYYRY